MAEIVFVGTGPGVRGLLTLRAAEAIAAARVVLYDEGLAQDVLAAVPAGARLAPLPREEAAAVEMLAAAARGVERAVRLVAGDPLTTLRAAQEVRALERRGLALEVVPGVPLEHAAAAFAGVGVMPGETLRLVRLEGAGAAAGELVRVSLAADAASARAQCGVDAEGALVVRRPGTAAQEVREARGEQATAADPAVLLCGRGVRERSAWYERRPLFGRRVVVTRPRSQASDFMAWLEAQGAEPVLFPAIRIVGPPDPEPLRRAAAEARGYDWVVFTSVNGVERFWEALRRTGQDARALGTARLAAIGPATAAALAAHGLYADLVPERYVAESVLESLESAGGLEGARILLPRAAGAREILPQRLEALGARVTEVEAYRAEADTGPGLELAQRLARGEIDAVTFTSSSTVRNFVEAVGADLGPAVIACIGPVTAQTAQELGLRVDVVAQEHTVAGLGEALSGHFATAVRSNLTQE